MANDPPVSSSSTAIRQDFSLPNPFPTIRAEIEKHIAEIKRDVRVAVETAILRETVRFTLSRLLTLDQRRAAAYQSALDSIGE